MAGALADRGVMKLFAAAALAATLLGAAQARPTVFLVGDSTATLMELGKDLVPILSKRKELRDVRIDIGDTNSELRVHVDRERAASFGFSG